MDGTRWTRRFALLLFVLLSISMAVAQTDKKHASSKRHPSKAAKTAKASKLGLAGRIPNLELTGYRPYTPVMATDESVKMTAAGNFVFLLIGNKLYKIDQNTLRVVRSRVIDLTVEARAHDSPAVKPGKRTKTAKRKSTKIARERSTR